MTASLEITGVNQIDFQTMVKDHPMVHIRKVEQDGDLITFILACVVATGTDIQTSSFSCEIGPVLNLPLEGGGVTVPVNNPIISYSTNEIMPIDFKYWLITMEYKHVMPVEEIFIMVDLEIDPPGTEKPIRKRGTVCIAKKSPFPDT